MPGLPGFLGGGGGAGGGGAVVAASEHGRARLTKSGANLLLSPHNGNSLVIDGNVEAVPSAGVTLAATGLTPDTDHFIYAFMSGATMTLEASTTGHAADAATGVEIKSGDSTRTLVGMARPITGPAWADTAAQRFVISWFNRRTINAQAINLAGVTTASTTEIEISTTHRAEWLTWADEMPVVMLTGTKRNDTAGQWTSTRAFIDTDSVAGLSLGEGSSTANDFVDLNSIGMPTSIVEGFHFSTLRGHVEGGTTTISQFHNSTLIRG